MCFLPYFKVQTFFGRYQLDDSDKNDYLSIEALLTMQQAIKYLSVF